MVTGKPVVLFLLVFLAAVRLPSAAEYHAAPSGKDGNAGTADSPWTLAKANATVKPGDTVILAEGSYTTTIQPACSGEEGKPIVYRAAARRKALITAPGGDPKALDGALALSERSWIVVDGIAIRDVHRFLVAQGASHLTIQNGLFENTKDFGGWENFRFRDAGDGMRILNNHFRNGTDTVSIKGGDRHLLEGNTFENANHASVALIGVQRSVVRGNRFTNTSWRHMLIQSTQVSPERLALHNLVEKNFFGETPCNAIQYSGNKGILRRNIFSGCMEGMVWAHYRGRAHGPEAWHTSGNRFYHNVVYGCGGSARNIERVEEREKAGMPMAEPKKAEKLKGGFGIQFATNLPEYANYRDQVHVNNIIFRNGTGRAEAAPTAQIGYDWDAGPSWGTGPLGLFFHNDILGEKPGQPVFFWADAKHAKPPEPQNRTLKEFEAAYPRWAAGNIEADPEFTDPDKGDFRLKSGSPCIDTGGPLTRTTVAGKGKVVNVGDAVFFCDGFGIVEPDVVRIGTQRAKLVRVDFEAHTLTVAEELAWEAGAPVSLDFQGKAPDMGAFETGESGGAGP